MQTSLTFDYPEQNSNPRYEIVANEFVLSYKKTSHLDPYKNRRINNSRTSFEFLRKVWDLNKINYQESFYVVFFRNMSLVGYMKLADGSTDAVMVDVKLLFSTALLAGASQVLLAHNHPSETLMPSSADHSITKKIVQGGKLLDIQVLDHIIICGDEYYSFADKGMLTDF